MGKRPNPELGVATSSICPRRGNIWLTTRDHGKFVMATTCKTWKCKGCRDRIASLIKLRIAYGVSILGRCWFITATFKTDDQSTRRDAPSVAKVWKVFLAILRKQNPEWNQISWFRVIETTKRGQPHLHLVVGGLGNANRGSIQARFRSAWLEATGDSFIVDVKPVDSGPGAARYMAKYLTKALLAWSSLTKLGFKRRWSRSRNWPGGTIRLYGTEMELWDRIDWTPWGRHSAVLAEFLTAQQKGHPLVQRTGDEMALAMDSDKERRRLIGLIKNLASQGRKV